MSELGEHIIAFEDWIREYWEREWATKGGPNEVRELARAMCKDDGYANNPDDVVLTGHGGRRNFVAQLVVGAKGAPVMRVAVMRPAWMLYLDEARFAYDQLKPMLAP